MNASEFASRCTGAKQTAPDRWIACCPAHPDKRPSLAIRDGNNGGVVIHCFGGCDVDAICGAIGVELADLFPPRPDSTKPLQPQRVMGVHPADALVLLADETLVVLAAARMIQDGQYLCDADILRVSEAFKIISRVRMFANL